MTVRESFERVKWSRFERGMELPKVERDAGRRLLLEALERIEHRGDAKDVGRALGTLEIALYDQACPTPYVEPVIPILVDLIPRVTDNARRGLVDLIAAIGTLSTGGMIRDGEPFDPASGWSQELIAADATLQRVLWTIDAHASALLPLLDDSDRIVRERVAFLLAYVPSVRPQVVKRYEARIAVETDKTALATLLIANAMVSRALGRTSPAIDKPAAHAASVIAAALAPGALENPTRRADLIALIDDPAARDAKTSFSRGALSLLALRLLAPRAFGDSDVRKAFVDRCGVTDPIGDGPHDARPLGAHTSLALANTLPPRANRRFESLEPEVRDVLSALSERSAGWPWQLSQSLAARGYPSEKTALGRYTGAIAPEARSWMEANTASGLTVGDLVLDWVTGESDVTATLRDTLQETAGADVIALIRDLHSRRFAGGKDWDVPGLWAQNGLRNARAMRLQIDVLLGADDRLDAALDAEIARIATEGPPTRVNPGGQNAPFGAYPDLIALARAVRRVRKGRPVSVDKGSFSVIRIMRGAATGMGGMVPYVREVLERAPLEQRAEFAIHSGITADWGFWLYADLAPTDSVRDHAPWKMLSVTQLEHARVRALEAAFRAIGRAADAERIEEALIGAYRKQLPFWNSKNAPGTPEHWTDVTARLRDVGLTAEAEALLAAKTKKTRGPGKTSRKSGGKK